MDRYIGRMLDNRYEILEVIGTGGMAVVYKARCHRLNRLVAIKILKDENLEDAEFRRRFRAEGQAVGMLNHPNIVAVFDVVASKEADYIVMELIDGISLKQYLEKKGVLNWKETLHFATQIAKALDHAHSKGLVHRDIKPHNVMVLKNGAIRVTDFGIARVTSKTSTVTKEALGSVHYISPEQAKGGRVDCRSDLYSLGVVMYEMITGRPPFDGESPVSVALQHIAGGAAKPSVLNPNIPTGLEQIIMKAMAKDAKDRYPNAAALLADLDALRKDPMAVFTPKAPDAPAKKPADKKTTAQKVVENTQTEKPPKEPPAKKPKEEPKPKPPKPPRSREERELSFDRVATAAIVLISLGVMVAVILFLGGMVERLSPQAPQQVVVPGMVGMHYERLPDYDGITVVKQNTAYSDEYDKGVVIRQLPESGTQVNVGTKVFVIVSLGKKPETIEMPSLVDMAKNEAQTYLNGLSMRLKIVIEEQSHDTIPIGNVISTMPAEGTELWEGASVTLYISTGKDIQTAEMPNLLQGGANFKSAAEAEMNRRGFTNVRWTPVDSTLPAGRIISQSVPAGEMVDLNALIVIEYASGKAPAVLAKMPDLLANGGMHLDTAKMYMSMLGFVDVEWISVDNSAPAGTVLSQSEEANSLVDVTKHIVIEYSNGLLIDPVTIVHTIEGLPNRDTPYLLTILHDGQIIVLDQEIQPGQTSFTIELTDVSVQKYMLYIDGAYYKTITVDFGTDQKDPEPPQQPEEQPTEPQQPEEQPTEPEQPEMEQ